MREQVEHYRSRLRREIAGKPWIVAMDVLATCGPTADTLMELGADRVLCVGASRGTGAQPDPERFVSLDLGLPPQPDMMAGMRAAGAALHAMRPEHQEQVERWDPEGRAMVVGPMFATHASYAGRPLLGARPEAWQRLEDKTVIDALWDAAGVEREPVLVVPATEDRLREAAARLDRGEGTVWAGDNKSGFHGAAQVTRWVKGDRDAKEAAAFLAERCDRARIMPFMEGIPCSIHGWVTEGLTLAFRPCEMVIFRQSDPVRFGYSKAASFWDPAPQDRASMRALARDVGRHLMREVGYRGVFTVDGVMTERGFRPTELNPRFGAALNTLGAALPDLPIYLLHLFCVHGADLGFRPFVLERLVTDAADRERRGGGAWLVQRTIEHDVAMQLTRRNGEWRVAEEDSRVDATLELGPAVWGGFLSLRLQPERVPRGPSAAGLIASALELADRTWDLGIGRLQTATDVRAASEVGSMRRAGYVTDYPAHDSAYRRHRAGGGAGWSMDRQEAETAYALLRRVQERPEFPRSGRLLELGCGAGDNLVPLAAEGYEVFGIDAAPAAIEWAREKADRARISIDVQVGDVRELPWADRSFDLVLDGHCLHCIIGADRERVLAEALRVLRPGGLLQVGTMCGELPEDHPASATFDRHTRCQVVDGIARRYIGRPDDIITEVRAAGFDLVWKEVEPPRDEYDLPELLLLAARPVPETAEPR